MNVWLSGVAADKRAHGFFAGVVPAEVLCGGGIVHRYTGFDA
jgi:hypothetical protein